jgi:hypothetical protein
VRVTTVESPATTLVLAASTRLLAKDEVFGVTETEPDVTERDPLEAVRVLEPAVFRVIVKDPIPLASEAAAGRSADPSLEVIVMGVA